MCKEMSAKWRREIFLEAVLRKVNMIIAAVLNGSQIFKEAFKLALIKV
jgi:hypothetical protein